MLSTYHFYYCVDGATLDDTTECNISSMHTYIISEQVAGVGLLKKCTCCACWVIENDDDVDDNDHYDHDDEWLTVELN